MEQAELDKRFTYHTPKPGQPEIYQNLRDLGKTLAEAINRDCPEGREKALAMTYLEQSVMWANAGITRS